MRYQDLFTLEGINPSKKRYIEEIGYETFYTDAKYCVQKWVGNTYNIEIEERLQNEEYAEFLNIYVLTSFKECFAKMKEPNAMGMVMMHIGDYKEEILTYLEQTFPFCFMKYPEVHFKDSKNIIQFLYQVYGVSEEGKVAIQNVPTEKEEDIESYPILSSTYEMVPLKDVVGSSIPKYGNGNWIETILEVDDKNFFGFILYIMQNNIFHYSERKESILKGMSADEVDGKFWINEGNHRMVAMKILYMLECVTTEDIEKVDEKYQVPLYVSHKMKLAKSTCKRR